MAFGLLIGLMLSYLLTVALTPFLLENRFKSYINLGILTVLCYICISILLQTKDDFRFVVPYVEFSRDLKGMKPLILDTSAIIDGRLAELAEHGSFGRAAGDASLCVDGVTEYCR